MQDKAVTTLKENVPWRRGVAWPVVAVQGAILLVIGIYILVNQDSARDVVRQLLAIVLVANGALDLFTGFRTQGSVASPYRVMRGSVALTTGLLVLFENVSDYLDASSSRVILAWGLLVFGVVGLLAAFLNRKEAGLRLGTLIGSGMAIIISILLFTGDETNTSRLNLLAVVLLVLGGALVAYAFLLYKGQQQEVTATTSPEAAMTYSEPDASSEPMSTFEQAAPAEPTSPPTPAPRPASTPPPASAAPSEPTTSSTPTTPTTDTVE